MLQRPIEGTKGPPQTSLLMNTQQHMKKNMFHLDILELHRTSCAPSGLVGLTLCAEKSEQFRLMREHSVDGRDKGDAPEACVRSCFLQGIAAH